MTSETPEHIDPVEPDDSALDPFFDDDGNKAFYNAGDLGMVEKKWVDLKDIFKYSFNYTTNRILRYLGFTRMSVSTDTYRCSMCKSTEAIMMFLIVTFRKSGENLIARMRRSCPKCGYNDTKGFPDRFPTTRKSHKRAGRNNPKRR